MNYEPAEWTARQTFIRIITDICKAQHIQITWFSDKWVARLTSRDHSCYIHGYTFPVNTAVASRMMNDKVATSILLKDSAVPVIPHYLLRLPPLRNIAGATNRALELSPLPLVIKPNSGESGGFDVYKCTTKHEVTQVLAKISRRYRELAISPFVEIGREYRVLMLDGAPLVIFAKIKNGREWRHNLKNGATPQLETDPSIITALASLAARAPAAMDGRIASVDIAETAEGYKIMELNGGIMFGQFSQHSPEYYKIAREAYKTVVQKSLA